MGAVPVLLQPVAFCTAWSQSKGWRASAPSGGTPGTVEAPLCSNGLDDDGDAAVDLADPGCADASSDNETPECDDGIDNDGDGNTDLDDVQCTSAAHTCETPDAGIQTLPNIICVTIP